MVSFQKKKTRWEKNSGKLSVHLSARTLHQRRQKLSNTAGPSPLAFFHLIFVCASKMGARRCENPRTDKYPLTHTWRCVCSISAGCISPSHVLTRDHQLLRIYWCPAVRTPKCTKKPRLRPRERSGRTLRVVGCLRSSPFFFSLGRRWGVRTAEQRFTYFASHRASA